MANQGYGLPPSYPQAPMPDFGAPGMPPQQPGQPPSQAYPPYNYQPMAYYYYISSKLNGLVLDVEGATQNPLARVVLWHKKDVLDAENQLWYNDYATGTIKSKLNNLCLEFKDGRVVVNNYEPGNPNQLWEGVSQVIKNRMNPNLVFEVEGNNKEPGAGLTAGNFSSLLHQQFEPLFPPPPPGPGNPQQLPGQVYPSPGVLPSAPSQLPSQPMQPSAPTVNPAPIKKLFYLVSEMHGKVMDIEGCNAKEGAAVIVYSKQKDAKNQLWYFDQEGLLRSALNDFVPCGSGKSTPLKMVAFTGGASQRFRMDGKKIVNGVGECADIRGAWKNDCAPVITYAYGGNANQHWKVEYV